MDSTLTGPSRGPNPGGGADLLDRGQLLHEDEGDAQGRK
jgi:hypothetical protein